MKQSEDYTIFAWKCAKPESRQRGLFAQSPDEFQSHVRSQNKVSDSLQFISQYTTPDQQLLLPAALTSRGLLIALPLLEPDEVALSRARGSGRSFAPFRRLQRSGDESTLRSDTYLALICRIGSESGKKGQILCIWLRKHPERGIFTRLSPGSVTLLPEKRACNFKLQTIYVLPS